MALDAAGAALMGAGSTAGTTAATGGTAVSMGAMLPVMGGAMALGLIGSLINGMADRQAMRAMMEAKRKQLMLWQKKQALDQKALSGNITRQNRELGGMRDVEVLGDQAANNLTAGNQGVMAALANAGVPGLENMQDMTAGMLPQMLDTSRAEQFSRHGSMEAGNQGDYRTGQMVRDAKWGLDSSLFPLMDERAQMEGMNLRFLGGTLGALSGVGGAIAPFLSGPSKKTPYMPAQPGGTGPPQGAPRFVGGGGEGLSW